MSIGWAMLADSIPVYPLCALLFADAGLSGAQIATLFLIWSMVAVVAEVPSGAVADRFSRRAALVAAGVLQDAGYVLWISVPGYSAFAAGFVLWGLGARRSPGRRSRCRPRWLGGCCPAAGPAVILAVGLS